eukprot:TRINITY_DN98211_c0_g1_i1.p2 TRINITY_DN98211_c0_g1~~TRINITY_DN98211_c0_g1_i1.p2  ORF type:complete len:114 (-),score=12.59 TRINITY_DN98211_c0_g1_i1:212-553(-)
MDDRNDAIDVRVLVEKTRLLRCFRNEFCDGARTVHGRENADVIAGACLAIGATVTLKGSRVLGRGEAIILGRVAVILMVFAHAEIVDVHMVAGVDGCLCLPDDLSVSINVFAR